MLIIPEAISVELESAARSAAPIEACGLLAGLDGRVTRFYPLTNADGSAEHFSLLPAEQFAAQKDMRACGLRLLAIWHSHPATPARMSEEDLRLAYMPDIAYVIMSLTPGEQAALRAFQVNDGVPVEMPLRVDSSGTNV